MGVYICFLFFIIVFVVLTITTIKDNKNDYEKYDLDGAKLRLKRLKIIMVIQIIISILILAFSIYHEVTDDYNSCTNLERYTELEIQTQNTKFEKYKGTQLGSKVLSLLDSCSANANSNQDFEEIVPTVKFLDDRNKQTVIAYESNNVSEYMNSIKEIKNCISKAHRYKISLEYNEIGFVSEITIIY